MRRYSHLIVLMFFCASARFSPALAGDVTGAGSSFAAPLYGVWGELAQKALGIAVNYQSVGSGAGINQIIARTVDFGATDKPLDSENLKRHHLYQFPTAMGAIVVIANVPGVDARQLHLDGALLAAIFDGSIRDWDDPRIAALNPDLKLPETSVAPFHRADASGTSYVFTSYLSKVSQSWARGIGAGASVAWPGGAGARGNDGIAAGVRQTEGGIGYLEFAFAKQNNLPMVVLSNRSGQFVAPTRESFAAAARDADWMHSEGHVVDLLDTASQAGWPIMSATYILIPDEKAAPSVRAVFSLGFAKGDDAARKLDYIPLPDEVKSRIIAQWPRRADN